MRRRDFLKITGAAGIGAVAASCLPGKGKKAAAPLPEGEMEYRINSANGDRVSLLGFGCMRWPMVDKDGQKVIDQKAVNEMVDYAIPGRHDVCPAFGSLA